MDLYVFNYEMRKGGKYALAVRGRSCGDWGVGG